MPVRGRTQQRKRDRAVAAHRHQAGAVSRQLKRGGLDGLDGLVNVERVDRDIAGVSDLGDFERGDVQGRVVGPEKPRRLPHVRGPESCAGPVGDAGVERDTGDDDVGGGHLVQARQSGERSKACETRRFGGVHGADGVGHGGSLRALGSVVCVTVWPSVMARKHFIRYDGSIHHDLPVLTRVSLQNGLCCARMRLICCIARVEKSFRNTGEGSPMDEIDEAIVELLEVDGRLTHREIARTVGLSRSAAAARVQRLITSGQVIVRGAVHPAVIGQGALAHVGLVVRGPAAPLAAEIALREDVPFLSLTSGTHGLVAGVPLPLATSIARSPNCALSTMSSALTPWPTSRWSAT